MSHYLTQKSIADFENDLIENERSNLTVSKYIHDIESFKTFLDGREITKLLVLEYKTTLANKYAKSSANSMLAAINSYFHFMGWHEYVVKRFPIQRKVYCDESKELARNDYIKLLNSAKEKGKDRLYLILQTICGTGIRVSELRFFTVESIRSGKVVITCKSKTRTIFLLPKLKEMLLRYAKSKKITSGAIFITKSGKSIDRSNIWREMKSICSSAGVLAMKVFPHNLRHLFARAFYKVEKDLAKLADVLGHSSIETTRLYIISTGAEHRRQMENMRLII